MRAAFGRAEDYPPSGQDSPGAQPGYTSGYQLMGLASADSAVAPGGTPAPGVAAGTLVPPAAQKGGKNYSIAFKATRIGAWSLAITSCSPSAPETITPPTSGPGVTLSPRGGVGKIVENTSMWLPCSYTASLDTRPGLTTGLVDRATETNSLTVCICGHSH
ncbi:MAG: hypothetical protein NVSMB2_05480 [Chloroflexota bacterium]